MNSQNFPELIEETFIEINGLKANAEFYRQLGKSRTIVSNWRTGRLRASINDQTSFIQTAANVIRKYTDLRSIDEQNYKNAIDDLKALVCVGEKGKAS